jgi:hypothetical protein
MVKGCAKQGPFLPSRSLDKLPMTCFVFSFPGSNGLLNDLQGKGLCGKRSIIAVLNFCYFFFKKKVIGPCGYEQTNVNTLLTFIRRDCFVPQ